MNPLGLLGQGFAIAAPLIAGKMGVGKNTTNVTDFGRTTQYDPNATRYGRTAGAADATANRFAGLAGDAQNRGAAQANYDQANWIGQNQASQARIGQQGLADAMGRRAFGQVPSIAEMQADRQMQQAAAAQGSAAAGARGAAGLALAGQTGAGNLANAQSAISNQAQINAANERMQAEQAASNAYTGIRSGDQNAMNAAAQMAQYNAQLQQNQRQANDQYANQLYAQEQDVRRQDLLGGVQSQNLLGTTFTQGQGQRADVGQANANREMDYYKQFVSGVGGAMDANTKLDLAKQPMPAMPAPVPGKAAGGPVAERRPYLVGEQGPELIVPSRDGYVLTNDQTRDAIARAYGGLVHGGGGYYPARAMGGPVMAGGMSPLEALLGGGAYGGVGGSSGPAMASYDRLNPDMSMDVQGSLKAHSDAATRYGRDPTGGMQGGGGLMGGMGGGY